MPDQTPTTVQATTEAVATAAATTTQTPAKEAPKEQPKEATPPAKVEPAAQEKTAETKPKEEQTKTDQKIELKLPDGSLLKPERVAEIAKLASEQGLSQAQAQERLDSESKAEASFQDRQNNVYAQMRATWKETIKSDPEMGGDKLNETTENAKRFVEKFGSESFKKAVNETGLGDHPELVRIMAKAGKALLAEDRLVQGAHATNAIKDAKTAMYGHMNKT